MNPLLLRPEVQEYLRDQEARNPQELALGKSPFADISPGELAGQVDSRQRSRHKLPAWYHSAGIYYPQRLSIEQSSSELTAAYKAPLLPAGCRVLDMTGGFGVDSFAFARVAGQVTYCEQDTDLAAIVRHNATVLEIPGIDCIAGDGVAHLLAAEPDQYDVVYLDPARRMGSRKVFRLEDCQPNILDLIPVLFEKTGEVLIKLAPMLDIQEAIRSIPGLYEVQVVSVGGECKELLCRLSRDRGMSGDQKISRPISNTTDFQQVLITAVTLKKSIQKISFTLEEEQKATVPLGPPRQYLYEPDAALLKAGAFKWTALHYGLDKLHPHTHLYTSDSLTGDFMGKITHVASVTPYAIFKKDKSPLSGNVITRNFPIKAEEIRKKHRIAEANDRNLYFCTDAEGKLIVIQTVPVTPPVH